MSKLITGGWFAGRKTYVTGTLTVLGAVAGYLTGELTLPDLLQTAIPAIMLMTVRHGVSTERGR
ncbi:hypothetical protein [Indioceanicola profundi]|uniref:hypothetical protein n=1 Tax=Indioceanicola profundi TaxID=2220096 RepID=UPI000E6AC284|nr:hypothetical protein [Indioceanicola profundi]